MFSLLLYGTYAKALTVQVILRSIFLVFEMRVQKFGLTYTLHNKYELGSPIVTQCRHVGHDPLMENHWYY